jgi:hypothetical protein
LARLQARFSLKDAITHTLTYVTEGNGGRRIKYLIQDYGDVRGRGKKPVGSGGRLVYELQ